jgi:glycosyltransferase involved in cell wall biosynthesis
MNTTYKVSVIVPTKNSGVFLDECLKSIRNQTYKNIELIVVDNFSDDNTKEIALKYADKFFEKGPERSAQVNYGVEMSSGTYVYKVDSDFVLDPKVVEESVNKINEGYDAVVVHNSPDTRVSWIAKIRKFEVDMYKYDLTSSSARFVKKEVYSNIGGFNSSITAAEDFDFQFKLNKNNYKTGFVDAEALHLGEPKSFWKHMFKYFAYGKDAVHYEGENGAAAWSQVFKVIKLFLKNWEKFLFQPILGISFLFYFFIKYSFGFAGFLIKKFHF